MVFTKVYKNGNPFFKSIFLPCQCHDSVLCENQFSFKWWPIKTVFWNLDWFLHGDTIKKKTFKLGSSWVKVIWINSAKRFVKFLFDIYVKFFCFRVKIVGSIGPCHKWPPFDPWFSGVTVFCKSIIKQYQLKSLKVGIH